MFKKSILALGFLLANFMFISARSVGECKVQLKKIAQNLIRSKVRNSQISSFVSASADLTEEYLIDVCDKMLLYRKDLGSMASDVESIKQDLINYLKSFVAIGMDIQVDPNLAFIYNVQNPDFLVTFKNPAGEIKTRKYALKVRSIGLKFELVIKIDAIKIVGPGFNYYHSMNREYELGSGFDMGYYPYITINHFARQKCCIGVCLTFVKIKGTSCVLMIGGIAFGLGGSLITGTGIEGALVIGGKMTPIAE